MKIDWLYKCLATLSKVDTAPYEDEDAMNRAQLKKNEIVEKSIQEISENVSTRRKWLLVLAGITVRASQHFMQTS